MALIDFVCTCCGYVLRRLVMGELRWCDPCPGCGNRRWVAKKHDRLRVARAALESKEAVK